MPSSWSKWARKRSAAKAGAAAPTSPRPEAPTAPAPRKRSRRSRRGSRGKPARPAPPRARKALKANGGRDGLVALAAPSPLEVGGDAHSAGIVVNTFIVILIFLNVRRPLRRLSRRVRGLLGDGVQHRVPPSPVELGRNPDAEPNAPMAGAAPLRGTADHDHRPARGAALVPPAVLLHGSQSA